MECKYDGCTNTCAAPRKQGNRSKLRQDPECNTCKNLMQKYGLTTTTRNQMLNEQEGLCLLCESAIRFIGKASGSSREAAVVDHCHTTGRVRGILCSTCNLALGKIKDSTQWLFRAAAYIEGN